MTDRLWARSSIIISTMLVLSGCAGSTTTYTPPSTSIPNISNETIVDTSFDKTWDSYVKELSQSFFVINNISKESRIINVSFSTNRPSDYVECGSTTIVSKHPSRGTQTFTYSAESSSKQWIGVEGTNHILDRTRQTQLEGRANIYIAPVNELQTLLRVNARYELKINEKLSGVTLHHQETNNYSISFSTQETGVTLDGMTCISKRLLEQNLLNLAHL
ncbi:MAG: hypothetical protein RIB30_14185 [Thalassospira sp.]|uniref:hypothetical protein n=1 Tax=Thalassospira sp. TaxID=1912094 RepID=UPI0032EB9BA6